MTRINLYQIGTIALTLNAKRAEEIVRFLTMQSDSFVPQAQAKDVFSTRALVSSPLGRIFHSAYTSGALDNYSLLYLSGGDTHGIPSELHFEHLALDLDQLSNVYPVIKRVLAVMPNLGNGCILNATQLLRKDLDGYRVRDADELYKKTVRDLLVKSYWSSKTSPSWLETEILITSAHIYSRCLSSAMSRAFDTDTSTERYMQVVFLLYYLTTVQNEGMAVSTVRGKAARFFLPRGDELDPILNKIHDVIGREAPTNMEEVCNAISGLGVDRLKANMRSLSTIVRAWVSGDVLSSMIALEYPPYFLWALLLTTTGNGGSLTYFIKSQKLNRDVAEMCDRLLKSHLFLPELS